MEIWQSDGLWYVNRNGIEHSFDSEKKARLFMLQEKPLEIELAEKIVGEILPQLRKLYKEMTSIGVDWSSKEFSAKLNEAIAQDAPLAGFPVSDWIAWGLAFEKVEQALNQPISENSETTVKDVLLKRYVLQG